MAKIRSFGAKLYINGVELGGMTDIQATGVDVSFIDTTSHDESSGFRTFVSGLKDGGTLEVTGKYNYADDGQAEWKAEEGIRHVFYIILSDNSGLAFEAIIGGFQTSNPLDDAVEFTAMAKITGEVFPVFPTITVTGTLTDGTDAVVFPDLILAGMGGDGRIIYTDTGSQALPNYELFWNGLIWALELPAAARWESASNVLTPDTAEGWIAESPATGTPIVTGS